MLSKMHP